MKFLIIVFFCVLGLGFLKLLFDKKRQDSKKIAKSEGSGFASGIFGIFNIKYAGKIPHSILIASIALLSLDIVLWTTATWMWNWMYHDTEGLFFWGLQITVFLFIFAMTMNKDENSKPISPAFLWTLVLIAIAGFLGQPHLKDFRSKLSKTQTGYTTQALKTRTLVKKKVVILRLLPGRWSKFNLSKRYGDIDIISDNGDVVVDMPNGRRIVCGLEAGPIKTEYDFTYGTYHLRPKGNKAVSVRILLTPRA